MKNLHLYIASCTRDGGIYHYKLEGGALVCEQKLPLAHPMYMALTSDRLYCVLKHPFAGSDESAVVTVELQDGSLGACSAPVGTHGEEGCHLCLSDGKVYVANYTSGNLCCLPDLTVQHSGHGPDLERQEGPHTHCIIPTPDGDFLCATDLGTDEIIVYDKNLNPVSKAALPTGAGPRHLVFSEDRKRLYCVNELRSGVSVFLYKDGTLSYQNTYSSLPPEYNGESYAAAIRLKDGKLYVSNRGHDSIACFDENGGALGAPRFVPTGGSFPRDFNLIGDLLLCANEHSDTVTVFRLQNGIPVPTDTVLHIPHPLAIEGMMIETCK